MFKLQFSTDNAAFDRPNHYAETARILRVVADCVEKGTRSGNLHDLNGNRVGSFKLTRPQEGEA